MTLFKDFDLTDIIGSLIFLDIDGTLINDNEHALDQATLNAIGKLRKNNQIYLCSNSKNHERNLKVAQLSGLEYIHTDLKKPSRKILELVDHASLKSRWVIGDKFLTDGLFAKNIDARFLKVKRIRSKGDRLYIRFLYWVDDLAEFFLK